MEYKLFQRSETLAFLSTFYKIIGYWNLHAAKILLGKFETIIMSRFFSFFTPTIYIVDKKV